MKTVKAWALVDKRSNEAVCNSFFIPVLYLTRQEARDNKWGCDKLVRVEIREVERSTYDR